MVYEFVQPIPESAAADGLSEEDASKINGKIIEVIIAVDRSASPYIDGDGKSKFQCDFCHVGGVENERQIHHTRGCTVISARYLMDWGNILNDQQEWEDSVTKGGLDSEPVGES